MTHDFDDTTKMPCPRAGCVEASSGDRRAVSDSSERSVPSVDGVTFGLARPSRPEGV